MEKSQSISKLSTALCHFQEKMKTISFDSDVKVETRTGGSYGFKYASLAKIFQIIRPIMADTKLSISQLTEETGSVTTILMHESGEYLQSTLKLPIDMTGGKNDAQKIGSAITYARRYALSAILGIATDEDDDGNAASGNTLKDKSEPKRNPTPTPAAPPKPNTQSQDNRPWLKEDQLKQAIARISSGELELCKTVKQEYRMRKSFSEEIDKACEAAYAKYGESVLPLNTRAIIKEALDGCNDIAEVDIYAKGMDEETQNNIAVQALIEARKRKLIKKQAKATV